MSIKQEPFRKYVLDEEDNGQRKTFNVSMNDKELSILDECMRYIQQDQRSKALKQIFFIGATNVLEDPKLLLLRNTLFKNIKNNQRRGINQVE